MSPDPAHLLLQVDAATTDDDVVLRMAVRQAKQATVEFRGGPVGGQLDAGVLKPTPASCRGW